MLAMEELKQGNLAEALSNVQDSVRKDPSSAKHRVFLFQLLCIMGDWDRAFTQLKVLGDLDAETIAMVQTYRDAMECEAFRRDVFAGKRAPLLFGKPTQWVALLLQALGQTARGEYEHAASLRGEAFELAPTTAGKIADQKFEWIADADMRMGPTIEIIMNGRYYWVPFDRVKSITIEEPEDLRDCVWMPAYFTWANGGQSAALIPTRYPGTENTDDPDLKLARKTEWREEPGDLYIGVGQRMLATAAGDFSLMDVREIELEVQLTDEAMDEETVASDMPSADG